MSTTTETETFTQNLQRFHASLPTAQQRMLETILETAQRTTGTTETTPEVTGYAATTGTPFTTLTRWLDTHTTGTNTGTTTGTMGRTATTTTTTT
ncbi:MAG TPA: hypothetical protein VMG10_09730 [Gemmataceae bacterium]|nr:hypothetical protein [Gemmataceae bacterium]